MGNDFLRRVTGSGLRRMAAAILLAALAAMAAGLPALTLVAMLQGQATLPATLPGTLAEWREALDLWLDMLPLLPFAMLFTVIGGLPLHLALAALRRQGFLEYALAGALGGGLLLNVVLNASGGLGLRPFLQGAAIGVVAGLVFRAVWRPIPSG
jgi:hypothetical protein